MTCYSHKAFFKIEEENISSINRNIRQLENDKAYAALSAELARTIQSAENILATAKAQLKEAKTAREQRRKEKELNAQEEAELIRESQFQRQNINAWNVQWKSKDYHTANADRRLGKTDFSIEV